MPVVPGVIAFRLDGERLRPPLALPLRQFAHRQLMYQSVMTAFARARLPWHKLARTGLADLPAGQRSNRVR